MKKVLIFLTAILCLWIVVSCEKVTKVDMGLSSKELTFENTGGEQTVTSKTTPQINCIKIFDYSTGQWVIEDNSVVYDKHDIISIGFQWVTVNRNTTGTEGVYFNVKTAPNETGSERKAYLELGEADSQDGIIIIQNP